MCSKKQVTALLPSYVLSTDLFHAGRVDNLHAADSKVLLSLLDGGCEHSLICFS